MNTRERFIHVARRFCIASIHEWFARFSVVIVCTSSLALSDATWGGARESVSRGARHREVAVTFDDLPVISVTQLGAAARRDITAKLLNSVKANKVPAIGFVNEYGLYGFQTASEGAPDEDGVSLLRMWLDAGLELGNHTFGHVDLHKTSLPVYKEDVIRGEAVTGKLLQQRALQLRYFRHPYLHIGRDLETRREVERFLAERGYRVAPVTIDNEDYLFAAAYSKAAERGDEQMMRRIGTEYIRYTQRVFEYCERLSAALFGREIKQILLLHANALNADYFGELAQMMKRRGYSFISLDEALRDKAYRSADTYIGEESINWLARWAITRGVKNMDNVLDDFPDVPDFVVKAAGPV
jgi:peptidoglycan/xylan/chitin deacetylase (PgdA/CDA1 family)